jgi:DNA-binding response OmpR family regulator
LEGHDREPETPFEARRVDMGIATVYMVGIDDLERVPDFLELGAVVVIAPDRRTLRRWKEDEEPEGHRLTEVSGADGLVIDLARRQVLCWDRPVALTDLEFRVLAALTSHPAGARSFRDLRRAGWGEGLDLPFDIYPVRSLVQRLRVKLRAAEAPIRIEAVRGYGYRIGSEEREALPITALTQAGRSA